MSCPNYQFSGSNSDRVGKESASLEALLNNAHYERQMYLPAFTRQAQQTQYQNAVHLDSLMKGKHQKNSVEGQCDVITIPQGNYQTSSFNLHPPQLPIEQNFRQNQIPLRELDVSKYAMKAEGKINGFTGFDFIDTRNLRAPTEPKTTRSYGTYPVQAALNPDPYQIRAQIQKYQ